MKKYIKSIVAFACLFFVTSLQACAPKVYTVIASTDSGLKMGGPKVAATGGAQGTVYLVWASTGTQFTAGKMGHALRPPTMILPGSIVSPEVSAIGSNVYVVSTDLASPFLRVLFTASSDYGVTFSSPVEISQNSTYAMQPNLAAYEKHVFLTWWDYQSTQQGAVLFRASHDAGQSFLPEVNLGVALSYPKVAVAGGNVYVAWIGTDYNLYFVKSTDAGASFSATQSLGVNPREVELIADGNNVYVSWSALGSNNNPDVFVRGSGDGGTTFSPAVNISNTAGVSEHVQLSTVGANVYVVWEDDTPGTKNVFYSYSRNNGISFMQWQNMGQSAIVTSWYPHVAASGHFVHIVWQANFGGNNNWEIEYRRSHDSGETFGSPLNNPDGRIYPLADVDPTIVVRGVDRYIAWVRLKAEGQEQVMFYSSTSCPVYPSESGIFRCLSK